MDTHHKREEQVIKLLSERRYRAILSCLNDAGQALRIEELADRLIKRDASVVSATEYEEEFERMLIALRHNHVPRLAEADLITFDREENVVAFQDYRAVNVEWLELDLIDELLARFGHDGHAEDAIGVIEGRQRILEYGRQLVDEADQEVFSMYADSALFEEECMRRTRAAINRGVDVYAGTQNPTARELTRKHLPGAIVWEPQADWMNSTATYPKVGRFVFVDREKLMIAIVNEPADHNQSSEIAMIGEGEDNPLVVLVRELLGQRLDHLDHQSPDFRSRFLTKND